MIFILILLVSCSNANSKTEHVVRTAGRQNAVLDGRSTDLRLEGQPSGSATSAYSPVDTANLEAPFTEIPPTAVEFLLDYTQSSAITADCLGTYAPLRQKVPLFFFSLANQRADMDVALGVSYFTKGAYRSVIGPSKDFRTHTTWYQEILNEPTFEDVGDNYAKVIDEGISSLHDTNQSREVLILIGDGTYKNSDVKEQILDVLSQRRTEAAAEGRSIELHVLLYCTPSSSRDLWTGPAGLDSRSDFITVSYIDGPSSDWLRQIAAQVFGISSDQQYWLDTQSRDSVHRNISGDVITNVQGVGLDEGGQLIVNHGENIIETSHELRNWFLNRNPPMLPKNDCRAPDVKIHYTGSGPVFHWLESRTFEYPEPSLTFLKDNETNIAILAMRLPENASFMGIESCYKPFLRIGDKEPPFRVVSSCTSHVCLENSTLVSVYEINPKELRTDITSLSYGFRRKTDDAVVSTSTKLPAPFLISQKIDPGYLLGSDHRIRFEGTDLATFVIPIPVLFFQPGVWEIQIEARPAVQKDASIEGLPPGPTKKCPSRISVREESEWILYNTSNKGTLEILMATNLGWQPTQPTDFTDFCGFSIFDIEFHKIDGSGVSKWACKYSEGIFACDLRRE